MDSDRRRAPRFSVSQAIEIGLGREEWLYARGLNISRTGILLATDRYIQGGTRVYLLLELGEEEASPKPVEIEGFVARCEEEEGGEYRVGVSFGDLSYDAGVELGRFLDRSLREQ